MDDTLRDQPVKRFKWVGTRPIRPDGVPKVTGRAMYGADLRAAGTLYGKDPALAARPCAHPLDRHLEGRGAARRQGGGDRGGLPRTRNSNMSARSASRRISGTSRATSWRARRRSMKAMRSPRSRRSADSIADEAASLIEIDYEVLPHVIDVDEAMKPDAPLLFEDMITRGVEPAPTKPSNISKRVEFKIGDLEAGFAAGRRRRREGVQDRGGAPGLYRAACLRRRASTPTARPRSGRRARGISSSAR